MMPATPPDRNGRSSWFMKFVESLFTALAIINVTYTIFEILPSKTLQKLGDNFFSFLLISQGLISILFAVVFSIYWQRKEIKNAINSGRLHAWFRGILRYWLALEISTYGFAKILKTQFGVAHYRDDMPVGQLNGFNLTWNYFAHSYALAVIIALCQIGGSILLLFRRTTLLGVFILLPVMVNIVLINFFFDISPGAFMNSVMFTLGLLYLLLLQRSALITAFFRSAGSELPVVRLGVFRNLFRFLAVALAFGLIFYFTTLNTRSPLAGKWTVEHLIRNGDTVKKNAWLTDTTAWTTLYVEEFGSLVFCANPYVYDDDRSKWTRFKYDSAKHSLQLIFRKKAPQKNDTVLAAVSHYDGKKMQLRGVMGKDTLLFLLTKTEMKK
jgi:hypothetical protein